MSGTTSTVDPTPARRRASAFGALRVRNFRIYLSAHAVASTGTWMQNIALEWLVLELSGSPVAVGITMACQFLPMLLIGMYGGVIADRYPKRTVLMITQTVNGLLAATLAVLTIGGHVRVEHVYAFALVAGLVFVVDNPTRQVFVNEVVSARYVRNAIALNAAVFQTTRLVGPAVAAVLISTVGTGWAFAANAVSYLAPLAGLLIIRTAELLPTPPLARAPGQMRSALRYVADRPHVAWTIVLVGVVGTFGLKFPVVLTAMATETFGGTSDGGAQLYGLFNVVLAVGSIAGALFAGARTHTRLRTIVLAGAAFGVAQVAAALAPGLGTFLAALVAMGAVNLAFQAMANSSVQSWVDPEVRGRVMGLYMLAFVGGTPLGGPAVGWITDAFGARIGMAVCGLLPLLAALVVAGVLARHARAQRSAAPPVAPAV
ncbi:MFS transporter [Pseudonocardia kunmingensis]|uniref:MFS transporter n=1 Tax=Pseudonocardia kunmingensis TaxID=630975 RepID=UPI001B86E1C0|nr:MFS transporter [Pseudonocardia kunmingensis]